jgi:hypothetical protein
MRSVLHPFQEPNFRRWIKGRANVGIHPYSNVFLGSVLVIYHSLDECFADNHIRKLKRCRPWNNLKIPLDVRR